MIKEEQSGKTIYSFLPHYSYQELCYENRPAFRRCRNLDVNCDNRIGKGCYCNLCPADIDAKPDSKLTIQIRDLYLCGSGVKKTWLV